MAELELRGSSRLAHERQQSEEEINALKQDKKALQVQLVEETKKHERILRDRNASMRNLAAAEKGAKRQVTAKDATITQLRQQVEKITADTIKKSTRIEELRGDSNKKSAKVDDLRSQRTGLRGKIDAQAALHQAAIEEKSLSLLT